MKAETVKTWLREIRKDRYWLATQIGVKKTTVDGWLSNDRPIPEPEQKLILQLMENAKAVQPKFSGEEWDIIEEARQQLGYENRQDFYNAAIVEFARKLIAQEKIDRKSG